MQPTTEWVEHLCGCGEVARAPEGSELRCTIKVHGGPSKYPVMKQMPRDRNRRRMVERMMPSVQKFA